jgi:hypothetical protein
VLTGRIAALTGITARDWETVAAAFPKLGRTPGRRAAVKRAILGRLASRGLATGRWSARLEGAPPVPEPTVYVSAHIGSLQALRYTLRARGIPVCNVVGPANLVRSEAERQDRIFDARHPMDFPHVLSAGRAHRVRSALRSGSLILAADLPASAGAWTALLGGRIHVDPRPFRLARLGGVACRPAFLTLPGGRWALTLGPLLPGEEGAAMRAWARTLSAVASRSPTDLDGLVYLSLATLA